MIYLNTFLYYTIFSSVFVIYGIGLSRSVEIGVSIFYKPVFYLKAFMNFKNTSNTCLLCNWKKTYNGQITTTECYAGCTEITHIDGQNVIAYEGDKGIEDDSKRGQA